MTDFVNAVSVVGFPIVAFGICAWFLKYVYDRSLAQYDKALDKLGTLAEAVNNNTKVLVDLVQEVRGNDEH